MRLQKAPLVTSGLVLGLLGLGNLLKDLSLTLNAVCGIFAFLIWIHLLCTMIKYFNNVKEQLNSPLVSSVFTTFFMSGFLGTTYLNTFFSNITFINSLNNAYLDFMPCGNYDAYDYFFNKIFKRFFT